LFVIAIFKIGAVGQTYSIKNRLNTKLSLSFSRSNEFNDPFIMFGHTIPHPLQPRLNARADCNYGVLNWLELGGYIGYIRHYNVFYGFDGSRLKAAFAPTFGVNINVHLLPFWVKDKNSRWEFYLTAKYGGAYLIKHSEYGAFNLVAWSDGTFYQFEMHCLPNRYRHEFGAGVGGGVYFGKKKQIFGLYAEALVGQFSYFPEVYKVYWTARVGIELKFTPNKKKKLTSQEDDEIMFH